MSHPIFEQSYKITTLTINPKKKLGLYGVLGFLQDIAAEHASTLNFGYEDMKEKGIFWVLVRQKLLMEKWPEWRETITIKTWTLPIEGVTATREFEIYLGDQKIGACTTTWMILDGKTRRPIEIGEDEFDYTPRKDYQLGFEADKIKLPEDIALAQTRTVQNSDLDMNHHVNNVKYSQWVLDTIPIKLHQKHEVSEFEINFLAETFLQDTIECYHTIQERLESQAFFMGKNATQNKIAFIARMVVQ